MKTDILYVVKEGSDNDYRDLRLSLRSIDVNCVNVGRVFIVGGIPEWVNKDKVFCYQFKDIYPRKHKNILNAIMQVVNHSDIGADSPHGMFMYSSDDHFYIQPGTDFAYDKNVIWYAGSLHTVRDIMTIESKGGKASNWLRSMVDTRAMLGMMGYNQLTFSQHANTWFSAEAMKETSFLALMHKAQSESRLGLEPSCVMGNYLLGVHPEWLRPLMYRRDIKIGNEPIDDKELYILFNSEREVISGSDNAANGKLTKYLEKMFEKKSRYEK